MVLVHASREISVDHIPMVHIHTPNTPHTHTTSFQVNDDHDHVAYGLRRWVVRTASYINQEVPKPIA